MATAREALIEDAYLELETALARVDTLRSQRARALTASFVSDKRVSAHFAAGRVTDRVRREVYAAVFGLAQETRDMARRLCPVDTGGLRASIYAVHPDSAGGPAGRRRSAGYFRAIKAASRRNKRLVVEDSPELVRSVRTQLRRNAFPQGVSVLGSYSSLVPGAPYLNENSAYTFMPMANPGADQLYVSVGVAAFYAAYVEYGTSRQHAKPFFGPAVEWGRAQLQARLVEAVKRGVQGGPGAP